MSGGAGFGVPEWILGHGAVEEIRDDAGERAAAALGPHPHAIAPLSLYQLDQTSKQPPQHTRTMLGIRAISLTDLSLSGFPFSHTHRQQ